MSGFTASTLSMIASISVSASSISSSLSTCSRAARSLICCSDSSPDTYRTCAVFPRYEQICSSSVDLPIPGAPPTNTSDPTTPPPPSTRSSSPIPVENRISLPTVTSRSFFGALRARPRTAFWRAGAFLSSNSTIEFQAPHAGHCPCQRGVSLPHSRQTNTVLDFILCSSSLQPFGQRAANRRAQPLLVSFVL